jgi:hypothetical protein
MIKAKGTDADGRKTLVLGLSFQNLKRLQAGDPIVFAADEYGYAGTIMLFAGKDEATMAKMLTEGNPGIKTHFEKGDS